jgi:1-acyl-sn-glycerol-3-phosphate acyltransferase
MSSQDGKHEVTSKDAMENEPTPEKETGETSNLEQRQQLIGELDDLITRLRALDPEYDPPPFSPDQITAAVEESVQEYPKEVQRDVLERLRSAIDEQWFDPETWKGIWYMLNYTLQYNAGLVKRRFTGEYDTDEWGVDWEFLDVVRPFFAFLYKVYWRVETTGVENIPVEGRALLVANHSGQLPWDGTMMATAVMTEHPAQRLVRTLYSEWYATWPWVSAWLVRMGQALATAENGIRLLEQDELVAVYPEGYAGVSKPFKERYRLARFVEGDFVKMALTTQAPVIPVSVVGAEETYIALANSRTVAKAAGFPYFTISPTFPWLGLLGLVPLPTKWHIDFGLPIPVEAYGPGQADNLVLVSQISDQVRNILQEMIRSRLASRRSVFF